MQRLLTAAVAVPLSLLAVFKLPGPWFFVLCVLLIDWGALEFARMVRPAAPHAPLGTLVLLVPCAALGLVMALHNAASPQAMYGLVIAVAGLSVGLGTMVLLARTPVGEALPALGVLAYGVPYFALPIASLYWMQQHDPWVVFLLCAIVWLGDTAAYYVGKTFGRHKLAPVVSPKKTWEGATAGFLTGVVSTLVWSWCQYQRIHWPLVAAGAVTAIAAQVGDLVESMLKRGAGVKDSGGVLPGHGGMFDRMDAMLFAAPVLLLGLWFAGLEVPLR
jgi:phosphatidate cytidylyltransferase